MQVACSVGGNLPGTWQAFGWLSRALPSHFMDLRCSQVYRTAPQGYSDQPDFLNWAFVGWSRLGVQQLLRQLLQLEQQAGRIRKMPNGPRILDIDLLLYGSEKVYTPEVTVPHPRMHLRAFALVPLLELWPAAQDPRTGTPVAEYLANLAGQGIYSLGIYPYNRETHGSTRSGITASFPAKGF